MVNVLIRTLCIVLSFITFWLAAAREATAHPHVWVVMMSDVLYDPAGQAVGIRHAWSFDTMFSTFATQGLSQKAPGAFTREDLAPLAQDNISSLKESAYFTYVKVDGKPVLLDDPVDSYMDFADQSLTLHFTLKFKHPVSARSLHIEIFDPDVLVAFAYSDGTTLRLVGAPSGCVINEDKGYDQGAGSPFGAKFTNGVTIQCPSGSMKREK